MKTVLLAGGLGSRLSEETVQIPKPMVEVGGRPIMLHVMDIYSHWSQNDFIIACGYKCMQMKMFFNNLHLMNNDFTVAIGNGRMDLKPCRTSDWNVSVVDTGQATLTGGRIRRLRDWLGDETFMVTYADGVGNVDIDALLEFHRAHGRIGTVTAVQPPARFGSLDIESGRVAAFTEKVTGFETWINGGFFVFEPGIFDYLEGDQESLEQAPLARLAREGQLFAHKHKGFWHPMDTVRDRDQLDRLCTEGTPPWLQFDRSTAPGSRPMIYA